MDWKPNRWIAAALGLLATPLGMLYVQRARLAVAYFAMSIALGLAAFFSLWAFGSMAAAGTISAARWALATACAVHAFRIARDSSSTRERKWYSRWYGLASFPVVLFLIVLSLRSFVYEPFRTPSGSMHPTIPEGSIMFVKKLGFGHYGTYGVQLWRGEMTETVARGDIVIHRLAVDPSVSYVRRVIGLPGDHVQYSDRQLTINGHPVPLRITHADDMYEYAVENLDGREATVAFLRERFSRDFDQFVPPDQYVMFGDNRDNARDSRYMGLVPREFIVGRVEKILSPGGAAHHTDAESQDH